MTGKHHGKELSMMNKLKTAQKVDKSDCVGDMAGKIDRKGKNIQRKSTM